jgi:hypothetical protein
VTQIAWLIADRFGDGDVDRWGSIDEVRSGVNWLNLWNRQFCATTGVEVLCQSRMNIPITSTTEALLPQIMALGYPSPEAAIEAALQFFHDSKIPAVSNVAADDALDTTAGFASLIEAEIIQDNERRWQTFQQQGGGIPQGYVESWVENLGLHDSYEAAAVLAQFLADHQATNNG